MEIPSDSGRIIPMYEFLTESIKGISTSDGVSLVVKAALVGLLTIGGLAGLVYSFYFSAKIRKQKAEEAKSDDTVYEIKVNDAQSDQAESDASELRKEFEGKDGDV